MPPAYVLHVGGQLTKIEFRGESFKEIELSRLSYSWLRFGLVSAGFRGLGVHDRQVYTAG